jgi:hypothetical protein
MKSLMPIASIAGLLLVIGPPIAYLIDVLVSKDTMTTLMLIGSVVWFVSAPFWMGRNAADPAAGQRSGEGR